MRPVHQARARRTPRRRSASSAVEHHRKKVRFLSTIELVNTLWRSLEAVELATVEWGDWFNNRRLLESIGYIPAGRSGNPLYVQAAELGKVA